ncbi:DNA methylase [Actinorugispora endophytica]|uniref:Adenine-specific DNA methylase n=1 Tax=Actinorugispora endophytica TaxID=1605990 RepID=A0A4R6V3P6_9ACTN|nr:DNA methylase [Actinorugispora endophytica]TDQ54793.1 adenine-specific DNA methylase [Actinorugispora endophytica]
MTIEVALTTENPTEPVDRLESRYDPTFVARLALREKQVQQSYRPIIQIHKWFARRPGSVFRSLLLSEFGDQSLSADYFSGHDVRGIIADPFMGGGTTVFEAARLGLSVVGGDVNPMAYWTVRQAVSPLGLDRFQREAEKVMDDVRNQIGDLYRTSCTICSEPADVKYAHLVKTCACPSCGENVDLFPGLRLAEAVRHPREVYHCPGCNALREVDKSSAPRCPECDHDLKERSTYRGTATCRYCGDKFKFAPLLAKPPKHRMYGIEYRCVHCYGQVQGRQFKTPDAEDIARAERASQLLEEHREELLIPDQEIQAGDETSRLHRWGYHRWSELFSDRQLLGLGLLMRRIADVENDEARYALATVFSDFLRYQNLLCRYDTYALKCQDIFAVHGFPVALLACENSLLGIPKVGSGSFVHFVAKYVKAKQYAKSPHETRYEGRRKIIVPIPGESIEAPLEASEPSAETQGAWLAAAPSQKLTLRPASLDGVFTDPPYFDMVQYAELMDFCYVWLRTFMDGRAEFAPETTRTDDELTGNVTRLRGMQEFAAGLSEVFCQMSGALKPGAPLVFTYHHNDPAAYVPLIIAILDAGLSCTATLVAPGEMSASLHIAGTKSSILDSVFVCRAEAVDPDSVPSVDERVALDAAAMREVPYEPTQGDMLCLRAGHVAADAIRGLHATWNSSESIERRFEIATKAVVEATVAQEGTS